MSKENMVRPFLGRAVVGVLAASMSVGAVSPLAAPIIALAEDTGDKGGSAETAPDYSGMQNFTVAARGYDGTVIPEGTVLKVDDTENGADELEGYHLFGKYNLHFEDSEGNPVTVDGKVEATVSFNNGDLALRECDVKAVGIDGTEYAMTGSKLVSKDGNVFMKSFDMVLDAGDGLSLFVKEKANGWLSIECKGAEGTYDYTVDIKDASGNALEGLLYGGSQEGTISSGDTISLSPGESVFIYGVPERSVFSVSQSDVEGVSTTKVVRNADAGSYMVAGKVVVIEYTNRASDTGSDGLDEGTDKPSDGGDVSETPGGDTDDGSKDDKDGKEDGSSSEDGGEEDAGVAKEKLEAIVKEGKELSDSTSTVTWAYKVKRVLGGEEGYGDAVSAANDIIKRGSDASNNKAKIIGLLAAVLSGEMESGADSARLQALIDEGNAAGDKADQVAWAYKVRSAFSGSETETGLNSIAAANEIIKHGGDVSNNKAKVIGALMAILDEEGSLPPAEPGQDGDNDSNGGTSKPDGDTDDKEQGGKDEEKPDGDKDNNGDNKDDEDSSKDDGNNPGGVLETCVFETSAVGTEHAFNVRITLPKHNKVDIPEGTELMAVGVGGKPDIDSAYSLFDMFDVYLLAPGNERLDVEGPIVVEIMFPEGKSPFGPSRIIVNSLSKKPVDVSGTSLVRDGDSFKVGGFSYTVENLNEGVYVSYRENKDTGWVEITNDGKDGSDRDYRVSIKDSDGNGIEGLPYSKANGEGIGTVSDGDVIRIPAGSSIVIHEIPAGSIISAEQLDAKGNSVGTIGNVSVIPDKISSMEFTDKDVSSITPEPDGDHVGNGGNNGGIQSPVTLPDGDGNASDGNGGGSGIDGEGGAGGGVADTDGAGNGAGNNGALNGGAGGDVTGSGDRWTDYGDAQVSELPDDYGYSEGKQNQVKTSDIFGMYAAFGAISMTGGLSGLAYHYRDKIKGALKRKK